MRLIDADALCEYANNQKSKTIDANDIMRFPTVDAEPVRHGRWITKPNMYWRYVCIKDGSHTVWFDFLMQKSIINERPGWFFEETEGWECSECGSAGYGRPAMMFEKPKYCPNCGTKMDGDGDAR